MFLYGESTTYGAPYGPGNSTARWLEQVLRGLLPGRQVRVANFGERGRGSYELLDTVRHTLAYEPDVVVISVGHNEFLTQSIGFTRAPAHRWAYGHSYLYRRAYRVVVRLAVRYAPAQPSHTGVPPGTDLRRAVLAEYRRNVDAILSVTRERKVPTVLSVPVSNLLGFAPVLSARDRSTTGGGRLDAESALATVRQAAAGRPISAADVQEALATHGEDPEVDFWYGRWLRRQGRADDAYAWLARARDLDAFPIRCLSDEEHALAELADRYEVPLLDLPAHFRAAAGGGPPGWDWFVSHCHPRPEGQYLIAVALARAMFDRAWLAPAGAWRWDLLPSFADCRSGIALTAEQWRAPEREVVLQQVALRPELALDILDHPPQLAGADDAEWLALRALAQARLGNEAAGRHTWARLTAADAGAVREGAAGWPPELRRLLEEVFPLGEDNADRPARRGNAP